MPWFLRNVIFDNIAFVPLRTFFCCSVDQGRFAQKNTRASNFDARVFGETNLITTECTGENEIRTCRALFESIKVFFKDNPGWS
jgi:hypothetical protein